MNGPAVEVALHSVVALNMANDRKEYGIFRYPVALVYITSTDPLTGHWWHIPDTQLQKGKRPAKFRTDLRQLQFQKYWIDKDWWVKHKREHKLPPW